MSASNQFKCVIWDLDNTLWQGVLLEDENVVLNESLVQVIKTLDQRGILHSIASRNDYHSVAKKLKALDLFEYFIYPEIHWNSKSGSVEQIAKNINIAKNAIAFVDDQAFERDEVQSANPEVSVFSPEEALEFLNLDGFSPRFITNESSQRRLYYQSDIQRNEAERATKNNVEFLRSLALRLSIYPITEDDLKRAEELTLRTHQLNTTGITYSYEELYEYMNSETHEVLCCSLEDNYGPYGTIGLVLLEKSGLAWTIRLLLVSCRVMSRNIVNTLIAFIAQRALREKIALRAHFVASDVNRQMYITYKFNGFEDIHSEEKLRVLELKQPQIISLPNYIEIRSPLL